MGTNWIERLNLHFRNSKALQNSCCGLGICPWGLCEGHVAGSSRVVGGGVRVLRHQPFQRSDWCGLHACQWQTLPFFPLPSGSLPFLTGPFLFRPLLSKKGQPQGALGAWPVT